MESDKSRKKEQLVSFGKHLRALRQQKGYSGVEFANILNVDKQFLSRLELGQSDPRFSTLLRLAEALEVHVADVLQGLEVPSDQGTDNQ